MRVIPALIAFASSLALFIPVEPVAAQSNEDLAKAYFIKASQSFEQGKYKEALESLTTAEQRIGGTNARISALKVKIHMKLGNKREAAKALEAFYRHDASETLQAEMADYLVELDQFKRQYTELDPYAVGVRYAERAKRESSRVIASKLNRHNDLLNDEYFYAGHIDSGRVEEIVDIEFYAYGSEGFKVNAEIGYTSKLNRYRQQYGRWELLATNPIRKKTNRFHLATVSLYNRSGCVIKAHSLVSVDNIGITFTHLANARTQIQINNKTANWLRKVASTSVDIALSENENLACEKDMNQFRAGVSSVL